MATTRVLAVVTAVALSLAAIFWEGLSYMGMTKVHLMIEFPVWEATSTPADELPMVLLAALPYTLFPPRNPRYAFDWHAFGAATLRFVFTFLVAWFFQGLQFFHGDEVCRYPGCWPYEFQILAINAPVLLALIATTIVSRNAKDTNIWIRRPTPFTTYITSVTTLTLIWDPIMIPLFTNPPPW